MILDASQLRGWPKERAELYGKPHLGARYTGKRSYEPTQPRCCVCGRRATNCHHVAHRGWGLEFELAAPGGTWSLRSPLFALCGSGTHRVPRPVPRRGPQGRVALAASGLRGGVVDGPAP